MGLHSNGRLLALQVNFRLGWKWMAVTNTLAYYDTAAITTQKSFILQTPGKQRYMSEIIFFEKLAYHQSSLQKKTKGITETL